ncbi:carbohydrate kinase [Thermococcus sp. M39]|uniref:PfkB family carbohydrate kinase n=1 Tax=Thermococcus sp. M39 TaxID=1638262 RepID=UPI00143C7AA0|nr:PfkB family carbohydrate kinase [Thermococcus sp. M39]NJE08750.1 carbohydrate kinase [Thermococcus sp. M39]
MKCIIIGHLTHDIIIRGNTKIERIGGGAYYSALVLSPFCDVEVITKVSKSFPREWLKELEEKGIKVTVLPSKETTTYELRYLDENTRILKLLAKAEPFKPEEIPHENADIVILNPVANEIPIEIVNHLRNFISLDVQGFVREFKDGIVETRDVDASFLERVKVAHADVNEFRMLSNLRYPEVMVISNGADRGEAIYRGNRYHFEPLKMPVAETTGAGDSFLAYFSYFYKQCPFMQALKKAVSFTAFFLKHRTPFFDFDEATENAKNVEVEKIMTDEETSAR